NRHSVFVSSDHSISIRLFLSISLTKTSSETPYISHSQTTRFPTSNLPLLLVNQNFVVISGFIKASNTSSTGFLISISDFTTGSWFKIVIIYFLSREVSLQLKIIFLLNQTLGCTFVC